MKKRKGLFKILVGAFVATVIVVTASAQTPCSTGLHEVFGEKSTDAPVLLERLGTSPQFGEIPKHTADAAYTHLKRCILKTLKEVRLKLIIS